MKRSEDTIGWYDCLSSVVECAAVHLGVPEELVIKNWVQYREQDSNMIKKGWIRKVDIALQSEQGPSKSDMEKDPGKLDHL